MVERDDSLWLDDESETVRVCQMSKRNRCKELTDRVQIGKDCSTRQVSQIQELLCKFHVVLLWMTVS